MPDNEDTYQGRQAPQEERNPAGDDQGLIMQKLAEERRKQKEFADMVRLQQTQKGVNGIDVIKNTHQLNDLEVQRPAGQKMILNIQCTGNLNGAPARCFIAAYSTPKPI